MNDLLSTKLSKHFLLSRATIKLITECVLALVSTRDVNLTGIAVAISGNTQISSGYKKLQRFFAKVGICWMSLAHLIMDLSGLKDKKWSIIIDRTNWKFGRIHINILVLSIEHHGVGIPILWLMLDNEGGNSHSAQREDLMNRFIKLFGTESIENILADREFIGDRWLKFLDDKGIKFYIRIRSDITIGRAEKELLIGNVKVKKLKNGETLILKGDRYLGQNYQGPKVQVSAIRNDKGELVIVATNDDGARALEIYKKRWAIETLFSSLKTRGFNFENTHMTNPERISKLLSILAIVFTFCHVVGIWRNEIKPIKVKKHGRKAMSLFRYGLDYIRHILFYPMDLVSKILTIERIFSPPINHPKTLLIVC